MKRLKITGMAACVALSGMSMLACEDNVANGTVTDPNTIAESTSSSSITYIPEAESSSSEVVSEETVFVIDTIGSSVGKVDVVPASVCLAVGPDSLDSHVVAYSRAAGSVLCSVPEEPTLFPVSFGFLHRLVPLAHKRLDQRGGTDQCNYYMVTWKHQSNTKYYNLNFVSQDSIAIAEIPANGVTPDTTASIQEIFVLELCGETLDQNTSVVLNHYDCGVENSALVKERESWLRADLVAIGEQCMEECLSTIKEEESETLAEFSDSLVAERYLKESCNFTCDAVMMEADVIACKYDPNDWDSGINCNVGVCEISF